MKKYLTLILAATISSLSASAQQQEFYAATSPEIRFVGRSIENSDGSLSFDWSGSLFEFNTSGGSCSIKAKHSGTGRNYYNVFINGELNQVISTSLQDSTILICNNLPNGEYHVRVQKRTEGEQGTTTLYGIESTRKLMAAPKAQSRFIEFIGDSHTCGYGTDGLSVKEPFTPETENCNTAWGCILARYFNADYALIAHSGQGIVRNYGDKKEVSDFTMKDRYTQTLDMGFDTKYDFKAYTPDIVVIKLGTNDFSCEISPSQENYNNAYSILIEKIRKAYGTQVPILCVAPSDQTVIYTYLQELCATIADPNLAYTAMLPYITNWDNDMGANYHPNYQGQRKMAMAIAPYIATLTSWEPEIKAIE